MSLIKHTTRFAVFPAWSIRRFVAVHFLDTCVYGLVRAKAVETKAGTVNTIGWNLGRWLLMYETPVQLKP